MNFGVNAIVALIKFALFIGVAGGLVDLTIHMRNEAVQAHKTGIVNLKTLNESLVGK